MRQSPCGRAPQVQGSREVKDLVTHEFSFDGAQRQRVDQFLAEADIGLNRSQAQRLLDEGLVHINDQVAKQSTKLRPGDRVRVVIPPPASLDTVAQDIPLAVIFEDEHIIVIDKAAGMVVHPAPGNPDGTLVNALLFHCGDLSGIGGTLRPGIVHRLDKDTSGVMVATKSDVAHLALSKGFHDKLHAREYLAICAPAPKNTQTVYRTLHGRHPIHRKRFSSKVTRGKEAVTHVTVRKQLEHGAALLSLRLETGRTHQIRVHCADADHPIIGDTVYGRRYKGPLGEIAQTIKRQALHARSLAFDHPVTGERLSFESPVPQDMRACAQKLGGLE